VAVLPLRPLWKDKNNVRERWCRLAASGEHKRLACHHHVNGRSLFEFFGFPH